MFAIKHCDKDYCTKALQNLCYDLNKLLWWAELSPLVRFAFNNVFYMQVLFILHFAVKIDR